MSTAFAFFRSVLINTLFDVSAIALIWYVFGGVNPENILFGWLLLLGARVVLWCRRTLLILLEHWMFRLEKIEHLTRAMRLSGVPRDYSDAWNFETLHHETLADDNAEAKPKQFLCELSGYSQAVSEISPIRGITNRLNLDAAVRRYLA